MRRAITPRVVATFIALVAAAVLGQKVGVPVPIIYWAALLVLGTAFLATGMTIQSSNPLAYFEAGEEQSSAHVTQCTALAVLPPLLLAGAAAGLAASPAHLFSALAGLSAGVFLNLLLFRTAPGGRSGATLAGLLGERFESTLIQRLAGIASIIGMFGSLLVAIGIAATCIHLITRLDFDTCVSATTVAATISIWLGGFQSVSRLHVFSYPLVILGLISPVAYLLFWPGDRISTLPELFSVSPLVVESSPPSVSGTMLDWSWLSLFDKDTPVAALLFGIAVALFAMVWPPLTTARPKGGESMGSRIRIAILAIPLLVFPIWAMWVLSRFAYGEVLGALSGKSAGELVNHAPWVMSDLGPVVGRVLAACGDWITTAESSIVSCGGNAHVLSTGEVHLNPAAVLPLLPELAGISEIFALAFLIGLAACAFASVVVLLHAAAAAIGRDILASRADMTRGAHGLVLARISTLALGMTAILLVTRFPGHLWLLAFCGIAIVLAGLAPLGITCALFSRPSAFSGVTAMIVGITIATAGVTAHVPAEFLDHFIPGISTSPTVLYVRSFSILPLFVAAVASAALFASIINLATVARRTASRPSPS